MPFDWSLVFKIPHSQMISHLAAVKVNYRKLASRKSTMQGAINEFESFLGRPQMALPHIYLPDKSTGGVAYQYRLSISTLLLLTRPQEIEV